MPVVIKDLVVTALGNMGRPITGEVIPNTNSPPMSVEERVAMQERLFTAISGLMENASDNHIYTGPINEKDEIDPDYITRLSTNEFFFYTQEPLTLVEFEALQNKIASRAKELAPGIQLVLGSFAVKTLDDRVMNIVTQVQCGYSPKFNLIIKTNTSPVDVRYEENNFPLPAFDRFDRDDLKNQSVITPIIIDGKSHALSFYNIVESVTPSGKPFITGIDICYDHSLGVAKFNLDMIKQYIPAYANLPMSHMVISNWVATTDPANTMDPSIGLHNLVHVDPLESYRKYFSFAKKLDASEQLIFGHQIVGMFELPATPILSLAEKKDLAQYNDLFLRMHSLKVSPYDSEMDKFIQHNADAILFSKTPEQKDKTVQKLLEAAEKLEKNPAMQDVKDMILEYRKPTGDKAKDIQQFDHANQIEMALNQVSIYERINFLKSESRQAIYKNFGTHMDNGKAKYSRMNKEATREIEGFKRFKQEFQSTKKEDNISSNEIETSNKPI